MRLRVQVVFFVKWRHYEGPQNVLPIVLDNFGDDAAPRALKQRLVLALWRPRGAVRGAALVLALGNGVAAGWLSWREGG